MGRSHPARCRRGSRFRRVADALLRRATLADGTLADVTIRGEHVDAVGAAGGLEPTAGAEVVELTGWMLLAAAVEPHAHLDKAFLAERLTNAGGDLAGAIETMMAARPSIDVADTVERAERAARLMAANGF